MVSASKLTAKLVTALSTVAVWVSMRLTAAAVIGLALLPFLTWVPPFLAPQGTAAPVAIVRTVPVPYLDTKPPEPPPPPTVSARETRAKILKVVRRAKEKQEAKQAQGAGKAGTKTPADAKASDPKADAKADPTVPTPSAPQAASKTLPSAEAKPEAGKTALPAPDTWSDAEVAAALRDCLKRLAPLGVEIEMAQPVRQERCGAPAPVVLKRLGAGAGKIELQPPPTLNCAMVAGLNAWAEKVLQPAAKELLGSSVVRMRQVSGYVCRNRIGTPQNADKLSEHALANALDVAGFVTADGRTIEVLAKWGPTLRDLREAQEMAWDAVQTAKAALKLAETEASQAAGAAAKAGKGKKREEALTAAAQKKEAVTARREEVQEKEAAWKKTLAETAELQKLTRGADAKAGAGGGQSSKPQKNAGKKVADAKGLIPVPDGPPSGIAAETVFLRRLHKGACGLFGTVLGPEANDAHRDHFHLDLAARKRNALCE